MSEALATDQELMEGVPIAEGIYLTPMGCKIDGTPTLDAFTDAIQRCQTLANASLWCLGDLLYYGEQRQDWGETYTQAIDLTGKSVDTLMQAVRLAKAYPRSQRVSAVSWSHHRIALAVKDPIMRQKVLANAGLDHRSVADLRQQIAPPRPPTPTVCPQCGHSW